MYLPRAARHTGTCVGLLVLCSSVPRSSSCPHSITHRTPLALQKTNFRWAPGAWAFSIPELDSFILVHCLPARRYPAVETSSKVVGVSCSTLTQVCLVCQQTLNPDNTARPTSQGHCHLMVKLILETSGCIDQFRFERTLWAFHQTQKFRQSPPGWCLTAEPNIWCPCQVCVV